MSTWIPSTPAGTPLLHLASGTREQAIAALLEDAAHMPYGTWENFEARGYTVEEFVSLGDVVRELRETIGNEYMDETTRRRLNVVVAKFDRFLAAEEDE